MSPVLLFDCQKQDERQDKKNNALCLTICQNESSEN